MPIPPVDEPLKVTSADGYVLLESKAGVAITLTPPAAAATGDALLTGAATALDHAPSEARDDSCRKDDQA